MLDPALIQGLKDIGIGLAIGATQIYNTWKHNQNKQEIRRATASANGNFDGLQDEVDALGKAFEKLAVKVYGERRATVRRDLTPEQITAARTEARTGPPAAGVWPIT